MTTYDVYILSEYNFDDERMNIHRKFSMLFQKYLNNLHGYKSGYIGINSPILEAIMIARILKLCGVKFKLIDARYRTNKIEFNAALSCAFKAFDDYVIKTGYTPTKNEFRINETLMYWRFNWSIPEVINEISESHGILAISVDKFDGHLNTEQEIFDDILLDDIINCICK